MYTIYGTKTCSKCKMAVILLDSKKSKFTYVDITEDQACRDTFKAQGAQELPVVTKDGIFIGGLDQLMNDMKGGK